MPVGFKFVDRQTGKAATLAQVDEEIAQFIGEEYDPNATTCVFLDPVAFMGVAILWTEGGETVTPENFESFAAKMRADRDYDAQVDEQRIEVAREFLLNRYEFHAWRVWGRDM